MLHTFSAADPLVKSCLFKLYCLSLYGCSLWNLSCHSLCSMKSPSITFFDASGISHVIAILGFCTSRLYCPAFLTWFNPGLPLSFPVHCLVLLMLSRPFFVTPLKLGLNAMFGHQFVKPYHHQHGVSAEVIRHLCLHRNPSEINDLVYTICTIFTPASVLVTT